jgi:hypothetical protein
MSSSLPVFLSLLGACAAPAPSAEGAPALVALAQAAPLEKPMVTRTQSGLAEAHRSETPVFERIELSRGSTRAARLYADGTQYLLVDEPGVTPSWARFVTITPAGVDRVRQVIRESVAGGQGAPPSAGPSTGGGTLVWVMQVDGKERVIETRSGAYDALPSWVRQLDEAVSQNVRQGG